MEYWAPTMQDTFLKESVALGIANTELRADLKDGDTLNKPYSGYPRVQTYTSGSDITVKDIDTTNEYLTVGTAKVASFYVDSLDKVQNKYNAIQVFSRMAQRQLNNALDQAVMANYSSASTTLNGASIGETDAAIVHTAANTSAIFNAAGRTLNTENRVNAGRFALIGPRMLEKIQTYVGGRETTFGDTVGDNGKIANRFGFELMLTNNLPFSAVLDMDTILTATDTVTINGVVFEADSDGAAAGAGHFSVQGSADLCSAQLASAINDDGTPGVDTYIALSSEDRQKIESAGIVATVDAGANTLTITGYGDIVVSTSNSVSAEWSSVVQYSLMGIKNSIDLVTQVTPQIEFRDAQLRLGKYVHPWMLYGTKTFARNAGNLVAAQFNVSDWK